MKKILTIIIILLCLKSYSQNLVVSTTIKAGSFSFDTILIPINTAAHFHYELVGFSDKEKRHAQADVWVSNTNGVYALDVPPIITQSMGMGSGITITKVGNFIIFKVTFTNIKMNWELKRS